MWALTERCVAKLYNINIVLAVMIKDKLTPNAKSTLPDLTFSVGYSVG